MAEQTSKEKRNLGRSDREKELIRSMFSDNETLQRGLRQFFLQLPMTKDEEGGVRSLTAEQIEILRREMLPSIADNRPVGMTNTVWAGVTVNDGVTMAYPRILIYARMTNYLEQQFAVLGGSQQASVMSLDSLINREVMNAELAFATTPDDLRLYVDVASYINIVKIVEFTLQSLWVTANQEILSPIQIEERNKRDSSE